MSRGSLGLDFLSDNDDFWGAYGRDIVSHSSWHIDRELRWLDPCKDTLDRTMDFDCHRDLGFAVSWVAEDMEDEIEGKGNENMWKIRLSESRMERMGTRN
jgi:hypothetical protein